MCEASNTLRTRSGAQRAGKKVQGLRTRSGAQRAGKKGTGPQKNKAAWNLKTPKALPTLRCRARTGAVRLPPTGATRTIAFQACERACTTWPAPSQQSSCEGHPPKVLLRWSVGLYEL